MPNKRGRSWTKAWVFSSMAAGIEEARRALFAPGRHGFPLVPRPEQGLLLARFGKQALGGVASDRLVQQPLRRANRIGASSGNLPRGIQRSLVRMLDHSRHEAVGESLVCVKGARRVGQLAHDVLAGEV